MPPGRTTDTYTFSTGPSDPAPLTNTLVGFLKPYLSRPLTTDECLDILRQWMSEDDMPTYHAVYNSLKRARGVRAINGSKARFTTSSDAQLREDLIAQHTVRNESHRWRFVWGALDLAV